MSLLILEAELRSFIVFEHCFNQDNGLFQPSPPIISSSYPFCSRSPESLSLSLFPFLSLACTLLFFFFFSLRSISILSFKEDPHFHTGSEVVLTGDPFIAGRWEEHRGQEGQAGRSLQSGQSGWTRYTELCWKTSLLLWPLSSWFARRCILAAW